MTENKIFVETIKEFMQKKGIDKKTYAKNSELSYKTINDILNGKRKDIQFLTILKLSIGLGLKPTELLDIALKKIRNLK